MNKLNQQQQEKLEIARQSIIKLQKEETIIYDNLTEEIGEDNDWIFDYVFNCVEESEYTNTVRNQIFE
jgi:uncharacterized circularly permuted ATP-grasp superfamily protein